MAGTALYDGAAPPPGQLWCTVCAMICKGEVLSELGLDHANKIPDGHVQRFSLEAGRARTADQPARWKIEPAVAWGVFQPFGPPGFGGGGQMPLPIPLCWSHLMGVEFKAQGVLPASAGMMAGLGAGGVLLGQQGR